MSSGPEHLALPARLDGANVGDVFADMSRLRGSDLVLDAADLERLGGLGLQLLLSARSTWAADGRSLSLANVTDALRDAFAAMGANAEMLEVSST